MSEIIVRIIRIVLISLFIGFIVNGLILLVSGLIAPPEEFKWLLENILEGLPEELKFFFDITEIPYISIGIIWIIVLRNKKIKYYNEKKAGLIGALVGVIIINIILHSAYFLDLLIGNVSSTGVLALVAFPFYAVIFGAVGYGVGFTISLKIREKKDK